jgi:dimeric dUTPase (all-alpha-NTP-PPase superfamily)
MAKKQKKLNRKIQEIFGSVISSESSVFSKEDVLRLLEEVNEAAEKKTSISQDQLDDLSERISTAISYVDGLDLVDDYCLEMDGNCVEIRSLDLDGDQIKEIIDEAISEWEDEI